LAGQQTRKGAVAGTNIQDPLSTEFAEFFQDSGIKES
jgi:hypothetical protein